ncbi:hypothetical protein FDF08_09520 [Micrococcus luteus]|nr:hypothetical protein FDF08_09520 [Micrococcus luteus]
MTDLAAEHPRTDAVDSVSTRTHDEPFAVVGPWKDDPAAAGTAEKVKVTDEMLELVEAVRPTLLADGMFLVGLDIVGDKLMEVNVFSPGGLGSCQSLYGVDFAPAIIEDLERKVSVRKHYKGQIGNANLATI